MIRNSLAISTALIIFFSAAGCSRYSVSINENVVYQPPTLFQQFSIADQALAKCVTATIAEQNLTKAERLLRLICPAGDIRKLDGLELFTNLEYLGLGDNKVESIAALASLDQLKQIDLKNNRIDDFSPLSSLPALQWVDARGNDQATCQGLKGLRDDLEINKPAHCKRTSN